MYYKKLDLKFRLDWAQIVEQVFLHHFLRNHMQISDQESRVVMIYDYIEVYSDVDAIRTGDEKQKKKKKTLK